jgi:hypothetical protein
MHPEITVLDWFFRRGFPPDNCLAGKYTTGTLLFLWPPIFGGLRWKKWQKLSPGMFLDLHDIVLQSPQELTTKSGWILHGRFEN